MKMKIESSFDVVTFVAVITVFAMAVAVALNFAFFSAEIRVSTIPGTMGIVPCITIPICAFVGLKIRENVHLSSELKRLVERDRLTNLATRDFFFNRMANRPNAYGMSLMVDIDFFKRVNDTYGHFAGDKVIKNVAEVLQNAVRPDDIVCRFGGEEFVIFLANTDHAGGTAMAERLRQLVAGSSVADAGTSFGVTVSIGGSLKEATDNLETVIRRADAALYRAKNGGRNQVQMCPIGNALPELGEEIA